MRIALLDLEGTLADFEFWEELAVETGRYELIELLRRGLEEGAWLTLFYKRVELVKGTPRDLIVKVGNKINKRIKSEARELINILKEKGFDIMIVSGGFEEFVNRASKELGVENYICNRFIYDNQDKVTGAIAVIHNKGEVVDLVRKWYSFVLAIGDGMNDYEMLIKSDVGISLGFKRPNVVALDSLSSAIKYIRENL